MRVRVKICGITRIPDALVAVDAGADAIGLMFYAPSPRNLSIAAAAAIAREIPPFIAKTGVFVNAEASFIREAIEACGLDVVQLHGEESPEFAKSLAPTKVVKAFRIKDASSLEALPHYQTDAWLLDSYVAGQHGGTGAVFNWDLATQAKELGKPVILAGGLTVENIGQAIHEVWPYAVDVSSGVESAPGIKDATMIREFLSVVREIEDESV